MCRKRVHQWTPKDVMFAFVCIWEGWGLNLNDFLQTCQHACIWMFHSFLHGHVNNQDTKTKHNQQVITLSMGESIGAE